MLANVFAYSILLLYILVLILDQKSSFLAYMFLFSDLTCSITITCSLIRLSQVVNLLAADGIFARSFLILIHLSTYWLITAVDGVLCALLVFSHYSSD